MIKPVVILADGSAFSGGEDRTCGKWTKSGEGSEALRGTGGAGLIYCFAAD
jgi:hypothetical protein